MTRFWWCDEVLTRLWRGLDKALTRFWWGFDEVLTNFWRVFDEHLPSSFSCQKLVKNSSFWRVFDKLLSHKIFSAVITAIMNRGIWNISQVQFNDNTLHFGLSPTQSILTVSIKVMKFSSMAFTTGPLILASIGLNTSVNKRQLISNKISWDIKFYSMQISCERHVKDQSFRLHLLLNCYFRFSGV